MGRRAVRAGKDSEDVAAFQAWLKADSRYKSILPIVEDWHAKAAHETLTKEFIYMQKPDGTEMYTKGEQTTFLALRQALDKPLSALRAARVCRCICDLC